MVKYEQFGTSRYPSFGMNHNVTMEFPIPNSKSNNKQTYIPDVEDVEGEAERNPQLSPFQSIEVSSILYTQIYYGSLHCTLQITHPTWHLYVRAIFWQSLIVKLHWCILGNSALLDPRLKKFGFEG
ncbi:uncharacterized protein MELLADRAFT_64702 [Melampsora larici-populina 98AG31]|uniref:Uncharacterized protein n=1 Tax=Melampsora larici-populina (strain 98AG31 / pathotype 3-4-7) TaxID=747676 RepID=F4RSG6_MELLP|nr:uncharacterized protein MELLADRAFT_64702 [Melampsora larici-populina 98AG31]EGG04594.1 hypothetical protein MELLADRAFT_64702 [Melampsora larici-populina 98AG31]